MFSQLSREILISSEQYNVLDSIKSSNKSTMVAHPDSYGAQTISAGQDNIGKILTALLSFKKLKDEHPNEYKGGLLFIDELDATLYPAAQKKLIEKLFRLSSDYKVQIVFTTHSPIVITTLFDKKYINDSKVIFLKEYSETISCEENLSLEQIEAKLNVSVLQKAKKSDKLRVYTEDEEARIFLKTLLPKKYLSKLEILKINLGSEELLSLANSRKVPEFLNNMIVLDGDKTIDKKHKNILCLPGKNANSPDNYSVGPDHLIYDYLKSLSSDDDFWPGNIYTGEYDKQFCFSNFLDIDPKAPQSRNLYKQWFKEQEPHWGSLKNKPFKQWKNDNPAQTSKFIESFIKVYNYLAIKNHLEPIK